MATKQWHALLEQKLSRRSWLKMGAAAAGTAMLPLQLTMAESRGARLRSSAALAGRMQSAFAPIAPTGADELVLPPGYSYNIVRAFGDRIADGQNYGYNNDYVAFFPINGLEVGFDANNYTSFFYGAGASSTDGLLAVNHEYINPMFIYGYTGGPKSQSQIDQERAAVGMSIFRVQRDASGRWGFVEDARNRRINAWTFARFTGPAAGAPALFGSTLAMGSVGNCSGGSTPWGTVLTCEENVDDYGTPVEDGGYGWDASYTAEHQGWVTEIDPYDPAATPRKHTALGRFRHENVAVVIGNTGKVVAYMGDDRNDSCVYKFVSAGTYQPGNRAANMGLLENGSLYVADFAAGRWRLLDYDRVAELRNAAGDDGAPLFASQADVLTRASDAALIVRGTPVDRPEDIEIHPFTKEVYVALTNNTAHGNYHGQIVRIKEEGSDPEATSFGWELFAAGGPQSGFSSPDNMIFDRFGNLWMVTDISTSRVGTGIYSFQANNAMFVFPTEGDDAGRAIQFASGPVECELTGQCWTPDGRTMFLSVQHPGEQTEDLAAPTSTWPRINGETWPRPSLVAINGFPGW